MQCRSCGREIPDNINFCPSCGVPQRDGLVSAQTQMEQQVQQVAPKKEENIFWRIFKTLTLVVGGYFLLIFIMGAIALGACMLIIVGLGG